MKSLGFDANEVKVTSSRGNYVTVEIETDYQNEILDEFTPKEIIDNYSNLDELYLLLKEELE